MQVHSYRLVPSLNIIPAPSQPSSSLPLIDEHHEERISRFLLHSRFNHSCIPNSKVPDISGEIIAMFATRDIVAGEEITFCYNSDFECRAKHARHQELR